MCQDTKYLPLDIHYPELYPYGHLIDNLSIEIHKVNGKTAKASPMKPN